ncbi:transposase [Mesorhizobium captivum]|uniref:transposase n=1 Tax=Mesorhizobium captivum TaxID=3072319 RepID=UPI002A246EF9|nr:transposase [Mesorhizobium sp. VK22E]
MIRPDIVDHWSEVQMHLPAGFELAALVASGRPAFDLFAALAAQTEQEGEVSVRIDEGTGERLILRLVIRRESPEQAQAEQERLLKAAKKRGKKTDPRSLEAAKYILLLTSLPSNIFPPVDVLALYRFRWQLELAFKRMKSLTGLEDWRPRSRNSLAPGSTPGLSSS